MTAFPGAAVSGHAFAGVFSAPSYTGAMLRFESALARAQAHEGIIPGDAADEITHACAGLDLDFDAVAAEGRRAASLAVPVVERLRAAVGESHRGHVHFGATSQDVLDTATALCLKTCLDEADRVLEGAIRRLARHAREHRATPMVARTLMQPAVPVTAGLRIARWAMALAQDRERLAEAQAVGLAIQLGGPVGALEALAERGAAVRHRLALDLGLADAPSWHVHRNAWVDLLGRIAQAVLTTGKIARDLALSSQPEVGEMREAPAGQGGRSSAMPHKRNPAGCARALAAALRVPGIMATVHASALAEHERSLGGWQAELASVPELADTLGTALDFLAGIGDALELDAVRMRANLATHGLGDPVAWMPHAVDEILAALATHT